MKGLKVVRRFLCVTFGLLLSAQEKSKTLKLVRKSVSDSAPVSVKKDKEAKLSVSKKVCRDLICSCYV